MFGQRDGTKWAAVFAQRKQTEHADGGEAAGAGLEAVRRREQADPGHVERGHFGRRAR